MDARGCVSWTGSVTVLVTEASPARAITMVAVLVMRASLATDCPLRSTLVRYPVVVGPVALLLSKSAVGGTLV